MCWVKTIEEAEARGRLQEIYAESRSEHGRVLELVKVQSLLPDAMHLGRKLYRCLMTATSGLSRLQRVLIATVVSRENGCFY